jgi:hypothetical protein
LLPGLRTVEIDHQDLDVVERAKEQIAQHMKAIQEKPGVAESPVSVAVDLETLLSGTLHEREFGLILDRLARLGQEMERLRAEVQSR